MSVEADFGLSGWVGQLSGTQVTWLISWKGVIEDTRFVGVSVFSDFGSAQLVRVSEAFSQDGVVEETIRANDSFGTGIGVPYRFSVVVIPNH